MPAKKNQITDAERAKRIRETALEAETSNDPADFERAFSGVVKAAPEKTGKPKHGRSDQS
jgi:hypothetical protein